MFSYTPTTYLHCIKPMISQLILSPTTLLHNYSKKYFVPFCFCSLSCHVMFLSSVFIWLSLIYIMLQNCMFFCSVIPLRRVSCTYFLYILFYCRNNFIVLPLLHFCSFSFLLFPSLVLFLLLFVIFIILSTFFY